MFNTLCTTLIVRVFDSYELGRSISLRTLRLISVAWNNQWIKL